MDMTILAASGLITLARIGLLIVILGCLVGWILTRKPNPDDVKTNKGH